MPLSVLADLRPPDFCGPNICACIRKHSAPADRNIQIVRNMTPDRIYLGVILVIIIIIIAYFGRRHWQTREQKDGFSYATPATPRIRDAVGGVFASLKHIVDLGHRFEARAALLGNDMPPVIAGARLGIAQMTNVYGRVEKGLNHMPPTYADYHALYRGMSDTSGALSDAADAYVRAGHEVHQLAARSDAPDGNFSELGNMLISMGTHMRNVDAAVHRLGATLDVE